jgi:excisionase family DNA binding protein
MAREPNGPKTMPTDDGPGSTEVQIATPQAEITQPTRNVAGKKKSQNDRQKRRNPLDKLRKTLNIPRSSIYLYARQGKIPWCVPIGRRYGLPDDIEQRLKSLAYQNWRLRPAVPVAGGASPAAAAKRRGAGKVWLSPRQIARRFRVGTSAVYGAVKRGEMPAISIGRHIRVPPDWVEDLLAT